MEHSLQGYMGAIGGQSGGRCASGEHLCMGCCIGVPERGVYMGAQVCMGMSP